MRCQVTHPLVPECRWQSQHGEVVGPHELVKPIQRFEQVIWPDDDLGAADQRRVDLLVDHALEADRRPVAEQPRIGVDDRGEGFFGWGQRVETVDE